MAYDEKTAERVRKVLSGGRRIEEKQLMGGLCFMANGAMCVSVSGKGGLLVRVGAAGQERALAEPHAVAAKMGRRTMTGFIRVALDGYRTDAALKKWIERSLDFVATLPAKPARGKASSGKPSRGKAVRKTAKSRKTRQPSPRNS